VTTSEQTRLEPYQHATDRLTVILERALRAYHRDERHGGASWMGERILDVELTPVAREAFRNADEMPPDREVLNVLDGESVQLLGE
jgi:lipid A disaccharide synthetase